MNAETPGALAKKTDFTAETMELQKMKMALDEKLGEEGILILPPHPRVAPMGLKEAGLPLSVQIVARHMKDHLTISCADFLEMTFGGWQAP